MINAYNIIGGATSIFLPRMFELNNNLHFLWNFVFKRCSFNQKLKFKITNFYNIHENQIFLLYASNYYSKNDNLEKQKRTEGFNDK